MRRQSSPVRHRVDYEYDIYDIGDDGEDKFDDFDVVDSLLDVRSAN